MNRLPAPSVVLDDQLCFALYAASRAVTAREAAYNAKHSWSSSATLGAGRAVMPRSV